LAINKRGDMRTKNNFLTTATLLLLFSFWIIPINTAKAVPERETWTLEATSSAYVSSANPSTHQPLNTYVYAKNISPDETMPLMKFDLSAIFALSGQPIVDTAFLDLYVLNPTNPTICKSAPGQFFILLQMASDWNENTVTKATMPMSSDEEANPTVNCPAQAGYQTFGAYTLAKNWLELRQPNYGLAFAGSPYLTGAWTRSFYSSRGSSKPKLRISFYDDTAPSFTGNGSTSITKNSAKITWETDEPSAVKVDWGKTTGYGSSQSNPAEVHELALSSLSPSTTYHFKLTGYDHFQNVKTTGDYTFTTLSESSTTTSTASGSGSQGATGSSKSSAVAVSAKEAVKTVDESIATPNVKYVTIGEKKTDAPFSDAIKVSTNEEIIVGGDSFPSAKIVLVIGDKAYSTDANSAGIWEVQISAKDLLANKYEVSIQAQDTTKDKGSAVNRAFDLEVAQAISTADTAKSLSLLEKLMDTYKWYTIGGLLILAIGCSGLLYILIRKRRQLTLK